MKENIDDVVRMLDGMVSKEISRMKIEISDELVEGQEKRAYHHGRCDIGSPFATGQLFDLQ